jgi:hypothetical protein
LDTQRIVAELKAERQRLDRAIAALDATTAAASTASSNSSVQKPRKRHRLTAAGRKRLSDMMKKRWAERKKNSAGRK